MPTTTDLCRDLCSGDQIKVYQARQALARQAGTDDAPGNEADQAALAKDLAAALAELKPAKDGRGEPTIESMNTVEGAIEICRALALVGGDAEVPAVAACLKNIDLRESARWCLARMTCPAATGALIEALSTAAGTEFRVGLLNALARKGGPAAAKALQSAVSDGELEVRMAAIEGLAEIPVAEHDETICSVIGDTPRAVARAYRARIRLAHGLLNAGNQAAAKAIFADVEKSGAPAAQQQAASLGLARC